MAGQSPKSQRAFANLKRICEDNLAGRYEIEVVDLLVHPQLARGDEILAIPTGGRGLADVGLSRGMLEGRTVAEVFPPDTAAFIEPSYRQALAGVESTMDTPYLDRIYQVRLAPVWDGGVVIAGMGYTQDVTDVRRSEQVLAEAEERFRTAFHNAPIGMALLSPDRRFVQVNDALCALTARTEQQLVGMPISAVTHPGDHERSAEQLARLSAGEVPDCRLDERFVSPTWEVTSVSLSASVVHPGEGRPHHVIAQAQNIHEQVVARQEGIRSQRALARASAFQAGVLTATPDIIALTDVATRSNIWSSGSVTALLGYGAADLVAMGDSVVARLVPEEDLDRFRSAVTDAGRLGDGERLDLRHRARHADGQIRWLQRRMTPFRRDHEGRVSQVLSLSTDVTDQVDVEQRLADTAAQLGQALAAAVAADQAKSSFLAATSHEIRTPLNDVLGMAGLLQQTDLDERRREYVAIVQASREHLLALLSDVLDFPKAEAGHLELDRQEVDLLTLVDEAVVVVAEPARAAGLAVSGVATHRVPRWVMADGLRLRQALRNPAVQRHHVHLGGCVEVVVDLAAPAADDAGAPAGRTAHPVRFTVTDTGLGIDPAVVPSLFEPFIRADAGTTRRYGGTGLGLAITREIALLHGGTVGAAPRAGGGRCRSSTGSAPPVRCGPRAARRQWWR